MVHMILKVLRMGYDEDRDCVASNMARFQRLNYPRWMWSHARRDRWCRLNALRGPRCEGQGRQSYENGRVDTHRLEDSFTFRPIVLDRFPQLERMVAPRSAVEDRARRDLAWLATRT